MRPALSALVGMLCAASLACTNPVAPDASMADAAPQEASADAPASDAPASDSSCVPETQASYPPGPYEIADGATLPDLAFATGDGREVSLRSFYEPCASTPRVLVIRSFGAWSGPSRWHAEHTRAFAQHPESARLTVLDLLVFGETNLPATARDLSSWRARYDAPPAVLALDPGYRFSSLFLSVGALPIVVLVDTRTMRARRVTIAPSSDTLAYEITRAVALTDGRPAPPRPPRDLYDARFSPDQWDMIRAMTPVPSPPASPTNRYADDPRAAQLGASLFADARLSPASVACSTCHVPDRAFADGRPRGVGVSEVDRNTPSVLLAAHSMWQFWDGRADSVWSQALGPCESPAEMGSSRLYIAHAVKQHYATEYAAVFGPLPPLEDTARFPAAGHPGDPAWEAMAAADRDAVDRVFANVGKAIEAFERTLRAGNGALDAYAAGDVNALTPRARDGLMRFFEAGCIQCHFGPRLTNDSFHNIQMPTGRLDGRPDEGRINAIDTLLASPFRANGPFSDAPAAGAHLEGLARSDAMLGQFRTPTLRAVAATGPWGHGGTFATLEDVMLHYARRGMMAPIEGAVGTQDRHLGSFHMDAEYIGSLVDVMHALTPAQ